MKAVEWIAKFEAVPVSEAPVGERFADVLKEFGVETAELVAARTKNSKPESRLPAADGAIREQKSKFRAICGRVPITEALFDLLLITAVPDYIAWQTAAQKKPVEQKPQDDVREYRQRKPGGRHYPRKKENDHAKPTEQGRKDQVHP